MIRPVATLPPVERERLTPPDTGATASPVAPSSRRRQPWWFIALEVILLAAVPALGYFGGRALLSTTAGTFTAQPLPGEPGWRALVDPSPVAAVAEVLDGRVTGITLVAQPGSGTSGGALVLVPGTLRLLDGRELQELSPADALTALSTELRLGFTQTFVVSPTDWAAVIGDSSLSIDNPDPIPSIGGMPAIPVGRVDVSAETAAAFLGTAVEGANPLSLLYRRQLFWQALLDEPPTTADPVAVLIEQVAAGTDRIDDLPTEASGDQLTIDPAGAEELIHVIVPLPSGSQPGDRVAIRIVDRSGRHDTQALALALGARGFEITEIANALPFDEGPTQLVVPSLVDIEAMRELAADLGADTVSPDPVGETEVSTVVLLVGSDIDLGN